MRNQVARATARLEGKRRYNTGQPCRNGHMVDRYVSNGACVSCMDPAFKRVRIMNGLPTRPVHYVFNVPTEVTDAQAAALCVWLRDSCLPVFLAQMPVAP